MAKEELIEMQGKVDEVLPDGRFRVTLENSHQLIAYSGGVDSTLLLRVATEELEQEALGILAVSPSLPHSERQQAVELAHGQFAEILG